MIFRRYLPLVITFMIFSKYVTAQWSSQWNGFTEARAVGYLHAVNSATAWATVYDPFHLDKPVNAFTRTTDGGNTWVPGTVTGAEGMHISHVFALDGQHAWVCMLNMADTGGRIFYTADGGQSWSRQDSAGFHVNPKFVHFFDGDTGLSVGDPYDGRFEIFTTVNGGLDWEKDSNLFVPLSLNDEYTLAESYFAFGDTIFFGGSTHGKIFVSRDKGHSWSFIASPVDDTRKVIFYDTIHGLIGRPDITNQGWELYQTSDLGLHWTRIETTGTVHIADLAYVPGTEASIVSSGQGLSFSPNGGKNWFPFGGVIINPSAWYDALAFTSPTHGWAGGTTLTYPVVTGGIHLYSGPALSVPENVGMPAMAVYPNPATDCLFIDIQSLDYEETSLQLTDLSGRLVYSDMISISPEAGQFKLGLERLNPGTYCLRLITNSHFSLNKLIVKH